MSTGPSSLTDAWDRAFELLQAPGGAEAYRDEIRALLAELPTDLLDEISEEAERLCAAYAEIARRRDGGIPLSEELALIDRERREAVAWTEANGPGAAAD